MRVSIILLLIALNLITVKAQDSDIPILKRGGTIELLYSVTLPYTNFGVKLHRGKEWGVYLHTRANFRRFNQLISPGFQYSSPLNSYTEFLGSFGVSYKAMRFLKPYIGIGAASHFARTLDVNQNPTAPHGWERDSYFGGETGLLIFIFERVVIDAGFCYVIKPSLNLGIGLSF